jgi:signal transduction histidine kinase
MPLRSLKARFILASVLWTAGLLAISHMLMMALMWRAPFLRHLNHVAVLALAIPCLIAGFVGVRRGLSPFAALRERLALVRDGRERRLHGRYPTEVEPLVHDLNTLLDDRDRMVARALATAGDLAHGLKTPLAVIAQEAERAEAAGKHELASVIIQQVERMQRQVDYHLAHARAAAGRARPGARTPIVASVEGLIRALSRLHAARGISIAVDVPPTHTFDGQREELDEMLGNLLDNACKWAASRVTVTSTVDASRVVIAIDDDGPGVAAELRESVLQRGVRADEATSGSGFGLAIVTDLVELYGGHLSLEQAPSGGTRARLELPSSVGPMRSGSRPAQE